MEDKYFKYTSPDGIVVISEKDTGKIVSMTITIDHLINMFNDSLKTTEMWYKTIGEYLERMKEGVKACETEIPC